MLGGDQLFKVSELGGDQLSKASNWEVTRSLRSLTGR